MSLVNGKDAFQHLSVSSQHNTERQLQYFGSWGLPKMTMLPATPLFPEELPYTRLPNSSTTGVSTQKAALPGSCWCSTAGRHKWVPSCYPWAAQGDKAGPGSPWRQWGPGQQAAGPPRGRGGCSGWARLAPAQVNTALRDHAAPSQLHVSTRDSLLQHNQGELQAQRAGDGTVAPQAVLSSSFHLVKCYLQKPQLQLRPLRNTASSVSPLSMLQWEYENICLGYVPTVWFCTWHVSEWKATVCRVREEDQL